MKITTNGDLISGLGRSALLHYLIRLIEEDKHLTITHARRFLELMLIYEYQNYLYMPSHFAQIKKAVRYSAKWN